MGRPLRGAQGGSGPSVLTEPASSERASKRASRGAEWYVSLHELLRTTAPFPIVLALAVILTEADALSPSGWAYALGILTLGASMRRGLPSRGSDGRRRLLHLGPVVLGTLLLVGTAGHRLSLPPRGGASTLGPSLHRPARVLTRLFEERDAAILGARWMSLLLAGQELGGLAHVLTEHYPRMREDGVEMGTPILATQLGWQSEDAFDLLRIDGRGPPQALDVVFLHGSGGSFTLLCWQVAISVRDLGVDTHCPAMGASGVWGSRTGRAILDALLDDLGERPVVLVGLSAGSLALSRMGRELTAARPNIVGLVLISGVDYGAEPTALPTLLLHGERDRMTPIAPARDYAASAPDARLVTMPTGHFALLESHETIETAISRFVGERLSRAHADAE